MNIFYEEKMNKAYAVSYYPIFFTNSIFITNRLGLKELDEWYQMYCSDELSLDDEKRINKGYQYLKNELSARKGNILKYHITKSIANNYFALLDIMSIFNQKENVPIKEHFFEITVFNRGILNILIKIDKFIDNSHDKEFYNNIYDLIINDLNELDDELSINISKLSLAKNLFNQLEKLLFEIINELGNINLMLILEKDLEVTDDFEHQLLQDGLKAVFLNNTNSNNQQFIKKYK